jgi:hypothetical protein
MKVNNKGHYDKTWLLRRLLLMPPFLAGLLPTLWLTESRQSLFHITAQTGLQHYE